MLGGLLEGQSISRNANVRNPSLGGKSPLKMCATVTIDYTGAWIIKFEAVFVDVKRGCGSFIRKHIYASAYYLYQMCCVWMPQCVCACVLVCPMSLLNESALNSAMHMELSWKCPLELKVVGYLRSRQRDISLCCVVK